MRLKKNEGLDFQNWVCNNPFNQITQFKNYQRNILLSGQSNLFY